MVKEAVPDSRYKCDQCDYVPSKPNRKTLIVHKESVHEGVKHACFQCHKDWSTRSNLMKHIKEKHVKVEINCSQCNFLTTSSTSLKVHEKRHHLTNQLLHPEHSDEVPSAPPGESYSPPPGHVLAPTSGEVHPAPPGQGPAVESSEDDEIANLDAAALTGEAPAAPPGESDLAPPGKAHSTSYEVHLAHLGKAHPASPGKAHPASPGESNLATPDEAHPASSDEAHPASSGEAHPASPGEAHHSPSSESHPTSPSEEHPASPGEAHPALFGEAHPFPSGEAHPAIPSEKQTAPPGEAHSALHDPAFPSGETYPAPHGEIKFSSRNNRKCHTLKKHANNYLTKPPKKELDKIKSLLVCDECGYKPKKASAHAVRIHKEAKHLGIKHVCSKCQRPFSTKSNLVKHFAERHEGKQFYCDQCDYSVKHSFSLKRHKEKDHTGALHHCNLYPCSFSSSVISDLKNHQRRHKKKAHRKQKREDNSERNKTIIECDECGYKPKIANEHSMKVHKEALHLGVRYVCTSCQYPCTTKSNLYKHMAVKHKEKNMRPNDGLKLFHCDQHPCEFFSGRKSDLQIHIKKKHPLYHSSVMTGEIEPGIKSVEEVHRMVIHCPLCGKEFLMKHYLSEHLLRRQCRVMVENDKKYHIKSELVENNQDKNVTEKG